MFIQSEPVGALFGHRLMTLLLIEKLVVPTGFEPVFMP
jgi:hypothetical protein